MLAGEEVYHKFLGKVTIKRLDESKLELEEIRDAEFDRQVFEKSIICRDEYVNGEYTKEDLLKSCKLRHIKYLYHITTLNNLKGIIKKGIIPRDYFINREHSDFMSEFKKRIKKPEFPDENRFDGKLECASFSISRINETLLKTYRKRHKDFVFCAVRFPIEVMVNNLGREYFFYHNASLSTFVNTLRDYRDMKYFNMMFYKTLTVNMSYGSKTFDRVSSKIKREYTTSPQAEIMIENIINPKYIDQIVFFDEKDKEGFLSDTTISSDGIEKKVVNI